MHIDSYQFGRIVIDGTTYTSDCIITSGKILPDWWRKEGHLLAVEDIKSVIESKPSILIVGCGAYGMMKIADNTHNFELLVFNTDKAVTKFNELIDKDKRIAAALHLTC